MPMFRVGWFLLLLSIIGCRGDPLGRACEVDEDCGSGYDCFPDLCVQVCTKDDECREGSTCYRYHCIIPGQKHPHRTRASGKARSATGMPSAARAPRTPPVPNATAAELRAIRRELELLRREQTRIVEMLERSASKKVVPGKKAKPKKTAKP